MRQGNTAPISQGLFDDLSLDEITAVRDYMLGQKLLNLTPYNEATVSSNYIYQIQFFPPPKDAVLAFLDNGGAKPERNAIVVVFGGATDPPRVEEYIVKPSTEPTDHKERIVEGQRYPIPFNARPFDVNVEFSPLIIIIQNISERIDDILKESYDGYALHNCKDRCLAPMFSAPMGFTGEERTTWFHFLRAQTAQWLHPLDIQFYINHTGSDPTKWSVLQVIYNNQSFDSVDDLITSYEAGTLNKIFIPAPKGDEALFSTYQRRGKPQPTQPMRGPEQYEPDGKRYTVSGRHVEYMAWSFDFRVDSNFGMQIFDIRFNEDRIVYELSLQEAVATYAGYHPYQYWNNFLDGNWALGMRTYEMVRGIDCPPTATFFDLVHFGGSGKPEKKRHAVCVFELNTGIPLRRHFENDNKGGFNFYGGMVNHALVLRSVATVGNYDYVFDFIFYQNGVIEVRVATTGYVFGTFYSQDTYPYAYPLNDHLTSATHDHLINYKVDLDVGGRTNSYETIEIAVEDVADQWIPGKRRVKKILKRDIKKSELEAAYKFNFDRPKYLNFLSDGKKNKMNVTKGYRIHLGNVMKQLYPDDWIMTPMFSWSLYQLAVTKYKENETRSSSMYNQNSPDISQVDFRKFLQDNDDIRNQDLVAWVTIGTMHVPHAEDLPNTATPGNMASFFIRPFNYFDEDPSMGSTNAVLITPGDTVFAGPKIERYGTPEKSVCIPKKQPIDYYGRYGT